MCSLDNQEHTKYESFREIQDSFSSKYNSSDFTSVSYSSRYTSY